MVISGIERSIAPLQRLAIEGLSHHQQQNYSQINNVPWESTGEGTFKTLRTEFHFWKRKVENSSTLFREAIIIPKTNGYVPTEQLNFQNTKPMRDAMTWSC